MTTRDVFFAGGNQARALFVSMSTVPLRFLWGSQMESLSFLRCRRGLPHIQQLHGVGVSTTLPSSLEVRRRPHQ